MIKAKHTQKKSAEKNACGTLWVMSYFPATIYFNIILYTAGKHESYYKYNKAGKLKKPELVELEYIEIQET